MKKLCLFVGFVSLLALSSCTKKGAANIKSSKDLIGKTIGVQAGTTGESLANDIANAQVRSFKTGIDASMALKNGAIDAIILDELPATEIVKRNDTLQIVKSDFEAEEYAIAVKKDNDDLLVKINGAINNMISDGTYAELVNSFMPVDGIIVIPEIDDVETSGEIRMGTNAAFAPFEYMQGSDVVGFDVSLSKIIANECGKKLKVVDMNFDALIAALQSGAVDFVAAGMTATEERRQNVDFSQPYYKSNQVIIVRK